MNNLYPNFNFLKITCESCNHDIVPHLDLRKFAEQISYECYNLKHNETKVLSYAFKCNKCSKIVNKNLIIERVNSVLIVC